VKCNKKLRYNFRDWHKLHPDKTFNDFAKLFCITDFDIVAQSDTLQKGKKTKKLAIILVSIGIFILIAGFAGYYGIKKFMDKNFATHTSESILKGDWERKNIGHSGISLELPFELTKNDLTLPESVVNLIDTVESFSHTSGKGFKVITFYSMYKPGIEASLDAAVQGAVNEIQNLKSIDNFRWERADTAIGSKNAAIVICKYNLLSYSVQQKAILICDKNNLWQVVTQFSEDDEYGRKASEKIISSLEISF
jgi:hypothetical protein